MEQITQEQRREYMRIFEEAGGKETPSRELYGSDVLKALRQHAGPSLEDDVQEVYGNIGRRRQLWTKPEYLKAQHVLTDRKKPKVLVRDLEQFARELNRAVQSETLNIERANEYQKLTIERSIRDKGLLQKEIEELRACNQGFDQQYILNSKKLDYLRNTVFTLQRQAVKSESPRSFDALGRLDALERPLYALEQEIFAIVPVIHLPDARTKLSLLSGRCEELQTKHVDAIQSLGFAHLAIVSVRRISLVRRLDILHSLVQRLHAIAGQRG